ncbi:MAG: PQQ-dependent sugar dehydrogenase [Comamonadaceae bacterium]|nr:PQQ-dependent sugar dehydrogenase [Comamonadaceae bacterium]
MPRAAPARNGTRWAATVTACGRAGTGSPRPPWPPRSPAPGSRPRRSRWTPASSPAASRSQCSPPPRPAWAWPSSRRGGTIHLARGGTTSAWFSLPVATSGEQGLLGLAFDPGWADPASAGYRRFFVDYSDVTTGDTVVASYRADATGTAVDASSRVEVMRVEQPAFTNHKAGWIAFKPGDANHLYIATGDGGSANDPLNVAQDTGSLLGKILRVDVNGDDFAGDPMRNYAIPPDNPFAGEPGARGEVFAYGLRNPWRNSFDRLSGDLWIADVGQDQREEIDFIGADSDGGQNFGWRVREGDIPTPGISDPTPPDLTEPLLVYGRDAGRSITGGYVVRDPDSPLYGQYVFGDFVSGRIWAVEADGQPKGFADAVELTSWLEGGAAGPLGGIVSFGEGENGELLIVDFGGRIVQIVPEPATLALWAAGLALIGARVRRTRAGRAPASI